MSAHYAFDHCIEQDLQSALDNVGIEDPRWLEDPKKVTVVKTNVEGDVGLSDSDWGVLNMDLPIDIE